MVGPTMARLIVISIDGLAGFYWDDPAARMPTLRGLAARGALAPGARISDPSALYPAPPRWDVAGAAGVPAAALDWPGTRRAAALGFNLPFFKDQRGFHEHTAPGGLGEVSSLGYPVRRQ